MTDINVAEAFQATAATELRRGDQDDELELMPPDKLQGRIVSIRDLFA